MRYAAGKVVKKKETSKAQRSFAAQELRRFSSFLTSAHRAIALGKLGSPEWRQGVVYAYNNAARLARRRARDVMQGK